MPTPGLLAKVVDLLGDIPMRDRDTKGDLCEYIIGKIASAGQNGQFRTPRHIIGLMVEMMAPTPKDAICDPACGTAGCPGNGYDFRLLPAPGLHRPALTRSGALTPSDLALVPKVLAAREASYAPS